MFVAFTPPRAGHAGLPHRRKRVLLTPARGLKESALKNINFSTLRSCWSRSGICTRRSSSYKHRSVNSAKTARFPSVWRTVTTSHSREMNLFERGFFQTTRRSQENAFPPVRESPVPCTRQENCYKQYYAISENTAHFSVFP